MTQKKDNNKEVTIYDIAEILKISPSTVSRALNNHPSVGKNTKKKILETAEKLGYRFNKFARNLRQQKTYVIGVIIPRLDSYFMSTVIAGMENCAKEYGYNLIITQSNEDAEKEKVCLEMLYNSRVDGILISFSSITKDLYHLELLLKKNIPIVVFDRYLDHPQITSVIIDNKKASYELVTHLISQGCKNIIHITGNLNCSVYRERFEGYKEALKDYEIDFDDKYIFENSLFNASYADICDKILTLKPSPDAIFASNDYAAVHILLELKKRNIKIPNEIAVAGFNDDPIASVVEPNLTTIKYSGMQIGEIATRTLIEKINDESKHSINKLILSHSLVIRKSTIKN